MPRPEGRGYLLGVYQFEGGTYWSYDYLDREAALRMFEHYFWFRKEGTLSNDEIKQAKYEALKANTCHLWDGSWLVSTTKSFPKGTAIAAPKYRVAYPPRTGWSIKPPLLQPWSFKMSGLALRLSGVALAPSSPLTVRLVADGKAVSARTLRPPFLLISDAAETIVKITDQEFAIGKEANYVLRILAEVQQQPEGGNVSSKNQWVEVVAPVMTINKCSRPTL